MRNWKVGVRLGLAFALLLVLMLLAVGTALAGIRAAEAQAARLERENIALLNAASGMRVAQLDEAVAIRDFVSLADMDSQRAAIRAMKASEQAYRESAAALDLVVGEMQNADLAAQVEKLKRAGAQVTARIQHAMDLSDTAEYQQAQTVVYTEVRPLQAAIGAGLHSLVVRSNVLAQQRVQEARSEAARSERRLVAMLAVALLLGVLATWFITRGIVRPLGLAVQAAERVAGGDLTAMQVEVRRDETGRLLGALAGMQERLNALVRTIRHGADNVSHASAQIAHGNTDLAARTGEQAASLEETAASIEELTASVKHNSGHASRASELASLAARLAAEGGTAVGGVVQSMEGIQRSSRKVSDIVALMDEMAFQTNLLALNAAVEAARAGEQGRGFGVVAAQVRVLAQRSAEASKDIRGLVTDAVGQSNHGAQAARRAGETMEKSVRVAQDVAEVVAAIARATEEQRTGIEQVNGTIAQLEGVTHSNTALVQEISALTESLLAQAQELVGAAGRFKLEDEAAGADALPDFLAAQPSPSPLHWTEPRAALT
jgi:methyl-accepting chemotaxis protein